MGRWLFCHPVSLCSIRLGILTLISRAKTLIPFFCESLEDMLAGDYALVSFPLLIPLTRFAWLMSKASQELASVYEWKSLSPLEALDLG